MKNKSQPLKAVRALGAMSGTSLDGVDAAVLLTDGVDIFGFGEFGYRAYSAEERSILRPALGKWPGAPEVVAAAEVVETAHAELLSTFDCELVGFHGQTLAHDPSGRGTHQCGDGAILAAVLERPVIWNFRSADVALGGQGAPLAPFFHHACARWVGVETPVVFLNLGGVGNVTWLDPRLPVETACLAFDTGPGKALIDDLTFQKTGAGFDRDGALAGQGICDQACVDQALNTSFFAKMPPKSLDRDEFGSFAKCVDHLSIEDALATLTAITVASVARGFEHFPQMPGQLWVCGGGRRNQTIMTGLEKALQIPVVPVESVGLNGDMLEAQAFAYLAVRVANGLPTSAPGTTGVSTAVGGGQRSG